MPKIILLNGPSGAGKSTTAKAILERVEGIWAHISQDDVRDLVKKGYRSANGMPDTWDREVKNQMAVSVPICCDIVRSYNDFGINCVVDLYAERDGFEEWRKRLEGIDYKMFILLPELETTLHRNQERFGTARLTDEKIAYNHDRFLASNWPENATVIDSTRLSIDEVVSRCLTMLGE
jgi:chloramphenicol 3-O-phosphotransferase